jgi:hypothetical protein
MVLNASWHYRCPGPLQTLTPLGGTRGVFPDGPSPVKTLVYAGFRRVFNLHLTLKGFLFRDRCTYVHL